MACSIKSLVRFINLIVPTIEINQIATETNKEQANNKIAEKKKTMNFQQFLANY